MQKKYTGIGYLVNTFYVVFFLVFFVMPLSQVATSLTYEVELAAVAVGIPLGVVALAIYRQSQFKKRDKVIAAMIEQYGWEREIAFKNTANKPEFGLSSLVKVGKNHLVHQKNCIYAPDWGYCDYSYDVYRKTKNGEYKESEAMYAVMGTVLPRKLPNIVFDSLKSRRRQFKPVYQKDQLHRLEGNFDQHFATYFPEQYTVDSLSFISPDVMLALQEADDYDIEIIDNNLFLYGSMKNPTTQIPEMAQKLEAIKKQLLDNILTYRDERLPYAQGRQAVTPLGARLTPKKEPIWIAVAIFLFYITYMILSAIYN